MAKQKHLTLQERSIISVRLTERVSFAQIAKELEKDPGTISREVKKHRVEIETGSYERRFNPCVHHRSCNKTFLCNPCPNGGRKCSFCKLCTTRCPDFKEQVCPTLMSVTAARNALTARCGSTSIGPTLQISSTETASRPPGAGLLSPPKNWSGLIKPYLRCLKTVSLSTTSV